MRFSTRPERVAQQVNVHEITIPFMRCNWVGEKPYPDNQVGEYSVKKLTLSMLFVVVFGSSSAFAHHMAADIVDEETYEMIDENVEDTPHADLVLEDIGM